MSKSSRLLELIRKYDEHGTVQPGVFSTLNEAIDDAPFETNTFEQWQSYLKPGRVVKREGVQFPLKKEELDWTLNRLKMDDPSVRLTKDDLRELLSQHRPQFNAFSGMDSRRVAPWRESGESHEMLLEDLMRQYEGERYIAHRPGTVYGRRVTGEGKYGPDYSAERLHHGSPDFEYRENTTGIEGLDYTSHYHPDTVSWSRATVHQPTEGGKVRLVEELQSDLHRDASRTRYVDPVTGRSFKSRTAARLYGDIDEGGLDRLVKERTGYRTPETEAEIKELSARRRELREMVRQEGINDPTDDAVYDEITKIDNRLSSLGDSTPDAPYKNPADYAGLELRKQLFDAAMEGDEYLALTRASDQAERYGIQPGDDEYATLERMYDGIYRSELEKLGRRFGAPVEEVELAVDSSADVRPETMAVNEFETVDEMFELEVAPAINHYEPSNRGRRVALQISIENLETVADEFLERLSLNDLVEHVGYASQWPRLIADLDAEARSLEDMMGSGEYSSFEDAHDQWTVNVNEVVGPLRSQMEDALHALESKGSTMTRKTFPAVRITEEIRDKILKTGVPQFQRGGLVRRDPGDGTTYIPTDDELTFLSDPELSELHAFNEAISGASARDRVLKKMRTDENWLARVGMLPERVLAGLESQWKTLDPETGEATFADIPMGAQAFEEGFMREEPVDATMARNRAFRPNIVDETIMIPGLPGLFFPETFGPPPEWAVDALTRSAQVQDSILEQRGLPEPEGFAEHTAGGLGVMLGQVPVPAGPLAALAKRVGSAVPQNAKRFIKTAAFPGTAAVEFLNPTVSPSVKNYATGALFGGALGAVPEMIMGEEDGAEARLMEMQERQESLQRELWESLSDDEKMAVLRQMEESEGAE